MGAKTAVIYARFSCSKQREASIEDQLRVCGEWCAANGYAVVNRYCDYAISGRTDDRPQFQSMVENAGESDVVVVYMMDRFSRDQYDAPIYKKRLRSKGVRVVSATESIPDGPEAIIVESIYEAMAAMESAHIAQRTRRGMEGNAMRCMHNGARVYGYELGEDGFYHVDEGQAENVRRAFEMRAGGMSYEAIARWLASMGARTSHGNPCNKVMAKHMLSNEKYRGVYVWGDTRVEGGMPRIVDDALFDAANGVASGKHRGSEEWSDYALAGKGVCMGCGWNLVGVSGRGRHGVKYDYYRCSHKCGAKAVRREWLESSVVAGIREMLRDPQAISDIVGYAEDAAGSKGRDEAISAARDRLSRSERAIENVMRAIEDGMPYSEVRDRLDRLRAERESASVELAEAEAVPEFDPVQFARYLAECDGLDDRTLLDAFVWQVQLSDDKVVAVLNYDIQGEPARIEVPTGSNRTVWQPKLRVIRTTPGGVAIGLVGGRLAVSLPRAA